MDKMSISNYYGREDLLQFYFNGKIVKHFSCKNVKKLEKGNNTINVIDPNYLIQKTNNIRFTFKTGSGIQNVININQNKNMNDLIKAYFDEIEMPYFYGSNIFKFLYNATMIKFDNKENIFNLMNKNNLNNNIIMVIDLNNLIQIKNIININDDLSSNDETKIEIIDQNTTVTPLKNDIMRSENITLSYNSVTEGMNNKKYNWSFKLSENIQINIEANEGNKMNELIKSFYDTAEIPAFYGREELITFKKIKNLLILIKKKKLENF